jgi:hypothetical protein
MMPEADRLNHEANCCIATVLLADRASQERWKRGLPKGAYYPDMICDYEIAFAPLAKWHRPRSPERAAEAKRMYAEAAKLRGLALATPSGKGE